jgi:hypothetical protein
VLAHTGSIVAIYRERDLCRSFRLLHSFFAAALIACLAGCGGSSTAVGPPPGTQHLYTDGTPGQARQFSLPLAGGSPTATLSIPTANSVSALAVDSAGNLAIGDVAGNITIFNGPITGSASSSVTFKNGTATFVDQLVFNSAGDLFATTQSNTINVFTHPLTSASTPSQVITSASLTSAVGIALDSAGNLIVGNSPSPLGSNVLVFAPPYTGAPVATALFPAASFRQMVIIGTQLFIVNSLVSTSQITVYNLPITAASVPAFSIKTGLFGGSVSASGIAVDSSGNLYAGLGGNLGTTDSGGVRIYVPPFSDASAPNVTSGVFAFTMAIGK